MPDKMTPGQDALLELQNYFYGSKTQPKNFKRLKSHPIKQNLKAMDNYFNKSKTEDYFVFFLVLPAMFLIAYIILTRVQTKPYEPMATIPQKDWETFEMLRLQKSLEEFDRDFLLQLAEEHRCKPVYKILMEKAAFEKVEKRFKMQLEDKEISPESSKSFQNLKALKKKLF